MPSVTQIQAMHPALRSRVLEKFLKNAGVKEPEEAHITMAEALVFSQKPSAKAHFPGEITIARQYDSLVVLNRTDPCEEVPLPCPGMAELGGYCILCEPAQAPECTT